MVYLRAVEGETVPCSFDSDISRTQRLPWLYMDDKKTDAKGRDGWDQSCGVKRSEDWEEG